MKKHRHGYNVLFCIYLCAAILLLPKMGISIVLHPDGEPNLAIWTDRPVNAVVGQWSSNASFVVVSPKWIVTTRHQNTNPAKVSIGGITYNCIYNSFWTGGPADNVDIRLIRLKNTDGSDPNLAYAPPYTTTDEVSKPMVIGGYGRGREAILYSRDNPSNPYGYTWSTGGNKNNNTQRWCTNTVNGNSTATPGQNYPYTSYVIIADFDGSGATTYEGTPAEYDSGGGWFIKVNIGVVGHPVYVWKVAGLTRGVQYHGTLETAASWYRDPNTGTIPTPDSMDAVRISSYATWINEIIAADCNGVLEVEGDLTGDCKVNFFDFAIFANQWLRIDCGSEDNYCQGADLDPDNDVDIVDLAVFAENWLEDKSL